jgi:hypothetical protein
MPLAFSKQADSRKHATPCNQDAIVLLARSEAFDWGTNRHNDWSRPRQTSRAISTIGPEFKHPGKAVLARRVFDLCARHCHLQAPCSRPKRGVLGGGGGLVTEERQLSAIFGVCTSTVGPSQRDRGSVYSRLRPRRISTRRGAGRPGR